MVERATDALLTAATRFTFGHLGPDSHTSIDVEAVAGIGAHGRTVLRWAIRCAGFAYSHNGRWLEEPIPSERSARFLRATRWEVRDAALETARALITAGHPDTPAWRHGRHLHAPEDLFPTAGYDRDVRTDPATLDARNAPAEGRATRYLCPLCDAWWYDQPDALTAADDPHHTLGVLTAEDCARLQLLSRAAAVDAAAREHLAGHTLEQWVAATARLAVLRGTARRLAALEPPGTATLTRAARTGALTADEVRWIRLAGGVIHAIGTTLDAPAPTAAPAACERAEAVRARKAGPFTIYVDPGMPEGVVKVVSGPHVGYITGFGRAPDPFPEIIAFISARLDEHERTARSPDVIAEIAAKRQLLRTFTSRPRPRQPNPRHVPYELLLLAAAFRDHPDYKPAWRIDG